MSGFDHFNLIGPIYDLVFGRKRDHVIVGHAEVKRGHRILDVGGGTGRVSVLFRPITENIFIADSARKMLNEAQEKGLHCIQTVSEHLPFSAESFDRIIMVDALHHVEDQRKTLDEMWRLLAPEGKIIVEEGDIHHWLVRLVSWGEKLLFMRSHFIDPEKIVKMCQFDHTANVELIRDKGVAWVIISRRANNLERSNG